MYSPHVAARARHGVEVMGYPAPRQAATPPLSALALANPCAWYLAA
jgi:hypothetical protein